MNHFFDFLLGPGKFSVGDKVIEGPFIFIALVIGFSLAALPWVYEDAKKRDKNGILAFLFIVTAGWPLSILWWLWLRPPVTKENKTKVEPSHPANPRNAGG
jgi:hypothetical protein